MKYIKSIDLYIIKKYLGTFFLSIILIISIAIIFDVSENIDDFITKKAPLKAIILDYYLNFIPYYANLFSALFTFIAVIFFTSKMAYNSEIIAILSSGITYNRLMRPYLIASGIIALMSWTLGNFVIPSATAARVNFRNTYISNEFVNRDKDIHRQLQPGVYVYMQSYNNKLDVGYRFSVDQFEGKRLVSKLMAESIKWDRDKKKWVIQNYYIRDMHSPQEIIRTGTAIDTTLRMYPADFGQQNSKEETMDYWKIKAYIKDLNLRGVDNVACYEQEIYKRTSQPASAFILAIIGVSLASRRMRGGLGIQLVLGLFLSFSYIMFMQISTIFAIKAGFNPLFAVWLPNLVYAFIATGLYLWASK
jgi:lipopolysaccharide export system permease protein